VEGKITDMASKRLPPLLYPDDMILNILQKVRTIAMVGASPNWVRPSNFVMKYLQQKGYQVIPVNPGYAGKEILGETVYSSLSDVPKTFQMVDIFRNSIAAKEIVDQIIPLIDEKKIQVVWMQLGVRNSSACKEGELAGLEIVMDRCPKIEYGRLFGELSWGGINSGIISSKRRRLRL